MQISLVLGDTEEIYFDVNLTGQELKEAFHRGCAAANIDCFLEQLHVFDGYNHRYLPNDFVQKIQNVGLDPEDYCEYDDMISPYQDKRRRKKLSDWRMLKENFPKFWLDIAKIGNPNLHYMQIQPYRINIGGSGLFNY